MLYLALRGVNLQELREALTGANYVWLIPAVGAVVAGQLARSARWQVLFGAGPRPTFRMSFAILSVGYLVSNLLPLRLGDPLRAWLIETRTPAGGAEALATVLVERAIDFLTIIALLAIWIPVPASRLLQEEFGAGAWASPTNLRIATAALVLAVYGVWVVLSLVGPTAGRTTSRVLDRLGVPDLVSTEAGRLVAGFAAGFAPLRHAPTAILAVVWTLGVWLIGGLGYWLVMMAFDLELPFAAAVFCMGATALFAVLPSSPGYIGVFHYAIRVGLTIYGQGYGVPVPDATALSYAIVLHGVTVLVLLVLGLVGVRMLHLSAVELSRGLDRSEEGETSG
jgi:uncharacterized protein (TIRG00374 family)